MDALERRNLDQKREEIEWNKKSLVEKWKDTYHGKRQSKRAARQTYVFCTFVGWYGVIGGMYTALNYIIPFDYPDSPDLGYLKKVFTCFVTMNCMANWICLQLYNTFHEKTEDRPKRDENPTSTYSTIQEKLTSLSQVNKNGFHSNGYSNGAVTIEMDVPEKKLHPSVEWRYCHICDLSQPPRCHHCNLCDKCILKRDHHCYITGRCIGHYNQRYFVMMNFFYAVSTYLCISSTYRYLQTNYTPHDNSEYFLPYTFMAWWNGNIPWHIFFMVSHFYTFFWTGPISLVFFLSQIFFISIGKTTFEAQRMPDLVCTSSLSKKFRHVFGNFWILNFIFPAQLVYKQELDGTTWNDLKLVQSKNKSSHRVKSY